MRSFVVVGQTALASADFSLEDLPGSSGRLDVLLRCVRAALLVSHGVRRDVRLYLVLGGGPAAPRALRVDGSSAKFLRPDERSLATLLRKTLAAAPAGGSTAFVELRPGVALANAGLDAVMSELAATSARYLLEQAGPDLRQQSLPSGDAAFFLGDHLGLSTETRARLRAEGATPVSVGPLDLHTDDVIAIVSNELDRARA